MDLSRSEVLDKAEAALALQPIEDPVSVIEVRLALRALVTEHRRLLAELDEAHAHFQVQEARIREARQVDDATEWEYECRIVADEPGWSWRSCTPDPSFCPSGSERRRRRPAGPWEPITEEEP